MYISTTELDLMSMVHSRRQDPSPTPRFTLIRQPGLVARKSGASFWKILNPLVVVFMEKTMVAKVISKLKSDCRFENFRETCP